MKRIIILLLTPLLIVSVFSGCKTTYLTKVKLSEVTHSIFYAPQYVAINKGFFEKEGLDVELTNGQGADKVMTAVLSGQSDIGFSGPEACIYVYNEGKKDFAKVFAQLTKRDGSFLLAHEPIPDFKWSDVQGKKIIGGRKGGVPEMTLEYVLNQNSIVPGIDVEVDTSIQFALMAGAFTSMQGDFVTLFEPTASTLEAEGKGYIVASIGKESGEIPYTAYYSSKSYIENNPNIIRSFTNAIAKAQQWVTTHSPEEIAEAIKPSFPESDLSLLVTVVKRYKDQDTWCTTPIIQEESFNLLQTIMTEASVLENTVSFDEIVDNSFANEH